MKPYVLILAASLLPNALHAQTDGAVPPPTYEYRVLAFAPTTGGEQVEAALNQLGSEGWEVVGVRSVRQLYSRAGNPDSRFEGEGLQVFLKRLREN
jgi:hypothetical protein